MDNAELVEASSGNVDTKKKKKDKVRSAWISFAGRIVAQMVGAIATVALGVMVLHRYTSTDTRQGHPNAAAAGAPNAAAALGWPALGAPAVQELMYTQPGQPVKIIVVTPAMLGLRDADERFWAADRSCAPQLDGPAASTAHLDSRPLLSR